MVGSARKWLARTAPRALGVLVVVLLAAATTAGFTERWFTPDDAPYLLLTRETDAHPVLVPALFVVCLAVYAVLFRWLCTVADGWRAGAASTPARGRRTARLEVFLEWTFARWWRVALVLAAVWLPFYVTSFPGQPSPDGANMFTEFLSTRSDFAGRPDDATFDQTAPLEDYPTSSYLIGDGDRLWSNHHPFYLMLGYGSVCRASIAVFGSLLPAIMLISLASGLVTLLAFGRALQLLGRLVTSWRHRGLALLLVALNPLIALWSLAQHKNQLFCAAFVWWLALLGQLLHRSDDAPPPDRRWYVEITGVSLLMAVSVQFGWMVLVAQAVALLLLRTRPWRAAAAMAVPGLLVMGTIALLTSGGVVIASDPIETKGFQLQELALILREHPDVLTADERAQLERIFDLDAMVAEFDPFSSDPVKSTGPLERKTDVFRYQTVQPEDWETFNSIVLRVIARQPGTALDGLFLKSYRYLDPLDEGTDWYPPWSPKFDRSIEGQRLAPVSFNQTPRSWVRDRAWDCYESFACRPLLSHGLRTVALVLLLAAAIAVRRRYAWVWALPFALQLAIAGVSPLSAGGRYVLAFTYGLGVVVLLLAAPDRTSSERPADLPAEPVKTKR